MTDITLKPLPPRPRPGDDRWWPLIIGGLIMLPFFVIGLGILAMWLVLLGEQFLPDPQAMIRIVP